MTIYYLCWCLTVLYLLNNFFTLSLLWCTVLIIKRPCLSADASYFVFFSLQCL